MDSLDKLMFSDEMMDFKKEEIEEKIDIDDNFLPSSSPAINGEETQRLDDNIPYLHFVPIVLVLLHESIPLFNLSAISSAESAPLYEPEVQGPGGEEELGILQAIELLEQMSDTLRGRYISPLSPNTMIMDFM
jgi:hypothetical protein